MSNIHPPSASRSPFDEDLLHKLVSQHSAMQQMWLSGYLYGIATHGQISAHTSAPTHIEGIPAASTVASAVHTSVPPSSITVLYGSQTGNSKKVANLAAGRIREQGWEVLVADMNDYPTKQLKSEKRVLLVVSTQGEGEPPVAAEEFHKWLLGSRAPSLAGLEYAVCALGDRSYIQFCQTGKELDARLAELGATRLLDRVDCDVDFEEMVETWISTLIKQLPSLAAPMVSSVNGLPARALLEPVQAVQYGRKSPFLAPILEKIQLNGRGSTKETWHLELSLEGSGMVYQPGDSLGIYSKNPPSLVQEVLYAAMLNGNKAVTFQEKEHSLRHFLLHEVEITVLTRQVLENYAQWTKNPTLIALLEDSGALKKYLWGRNVADLIREFPAAMSEASLLGMLRKMPPRLYSIASSLEAHPQEVHLTVAAVRYQYGGRKHEGAASTYLADRVLEGETVPVFVEHNEYFKLPSDDHTDIIMVGPGTGVAPFRAFVAERAERGARGKNWLFFGNPHFETDFLYQTEWINHLKRGTLDRLEVAFSRDQADKIYVQHRLAERSKLLFERLEKGAYFYVCGDKERMAADVQQALEKIIAQESGQGADYASEYVIGLKKQRRYLLDVY